MKRCKPDWSTSIVCLFLGIAVGFALCHKLYSGFDREFRQFPLTELPK